MCSVPHCVCDVSCHSVFKIPPVACKYFQGESFNSKAMSDAIKIESPPLEHLQTLSACSQRQKHTFSSVDVQQNTCVSLIYSTAKHVCRVVIIWQHLVIFQTQLCGLWTQHAANVGTRLLPVSLSDGGVGSTQLCFRSPGYSEIWERKKRVKNN